MKKDLRQFSNEELYQRVLAKFGINEMPRFLFIVSKDTYFGNYGLVEDYKDLNRGELEKILSWNRKNVIKAEDSIFIHDGNATTIEFNKNNAIYDGVATGRKNYKDNSMEIVQLNGSWTWIKGDDVLC